MVHADGLGHGLFRAHVAQRAHEVSGDGQPGLSLAAVSQAEVGDPQADAARFGFVSRLRAMAEPASTSRLAGLISRCTTPS